MSGRELDETPDVIYAYGEKREIPKWLGDYIDSILEERHHLRQDLDVLAERLTQAEGHR